MTIAPAPPLAALKTPEEAAELLRGGTAVLASSNQSVTLSYSNGLFVLSWSATNIDSYDWVGLYTSITSRDSEYIGGAWQWAVNGSSYATAESVRTGYQARYLVWSSSRGEYVSVARTDPFPTIRICSA